VQSGVVYEDDEFTVSCGLLHHRIPAFGYRVAEKDRTGRFDIDKAKALEIPSGPIYGQLKRGETVTLADGRVINGSELCGSTEIGRKIAYCTDTVYCDGAVQLAQDADVLIHEATFDDAMSGDAIKKQHSTTSEAVGMGIRMKCKHIILTHFSQRYMSTAQVELTNNNDQQLTRYRYSVAYDFMRFAYPTQINCLPMITTTLSKFYEEYYDLRKRSS
jgi:ribonuclease Z